MFGLISDQFQEELGEIEETQTYESCRHQHLLLPTLHLRLRQYPMQILPKHWRTDAETSTNFHSEKQNQTIQEANPAESKRMSGSRIRI
jgi:hypothetical protein